MHYLQEMFTILKRAEFLGSRVTKNGTRLIGQVPHVGSEAWLHIVFSPISDQEIKKLENDIEITFPDIFKDFLTMMNGISLFSGSLSIYGFRNSWERTGDAVWQPFSIITPNNSERLFDSKSVYLFIGGYPSKKGNYLYIDITDSSVYRCSRESTRPLQKWNDFPEMLLSETKRLAGFFDENGRRIDSGRDVE